MKYFIALFLLINISKIYAQTNSFFNDSVLVVNYIFTNFKSNLKVPKDMKMIMDNNVSYFFISNPEFVKEDDTKLPTFIKYMDSNYLLFNSPMMPKYNRFTYFSDSLHHMEWTFVNKAEIINGREAYMATTFFRGRYFTAFYDPNIPFPNGPYKFGGLPGLIIKLYDKDKMFHFELKSIVREKRNYHLSQINVVGNYQDFVRIYPPWQRKFDEKLAAQETTDPNCPTCGVKTKRYTYEIIEGLDAE